MKNDIHPEYRPVVFKDVSADFAFLGKSTIKTEDTIAWEDGNEYPLVKLEISSASHPFFTGKQMFVDTAGRVDKFFARYGNKRGAGKKNTQSGQKASDDEGQSEAASTSEES